MAEELKIPPFGESITSANVSRWLVSEGDFVKKGEVVVSLETDKVSQELEAPIDGVIKILVQEDEEVEIGVAIAEFEASEAAPAGKSDGPTPEEKSAPSADKEVSSPSGEIREVVIPPFGESITSASLAAWRVASGAQVEKGQTLLSLETDKISQDLEAEVGGSIEILVEEGEEVEIGTVIAKLPKARLEALVLRKSLNLLLRRR